MTFGLGLLLGITLFAVSASSSFSTPLEPAYLLVYGPGHDRFLNFTTIGAIPTVLILFVSILLTRRFWS